MSISRGVCAISFVISSLLATSNPTNAVALNKRSTNCDTGPGWASPVLSIGASGYGPNDGYDYSCETSFGNDYTPVSALEVWTKGDGDHIAGLQFTYASGKTSQVYGQEDTSSTPSATLTLAPGEIIKNAILYGDGHGNWLGHIHVETTKQTFDAGIDTKKINPYGINCGSGLLYGGNIVTHSSDKGPGSDIASLAFLFMAQPIDHISVTDIAFDSDPSGTNSGISPQNVVVGQWYDDTNNNVGYSLSPTYAVAESYSYSQSSTSSFGGSTSIEISGELFGIGAKSDTSFTWAVSSESATTIGTTSTTAVACVATGTLTPSSGVKVVGTYQTGKGIFDYISKVTVYLKDGTSFNYQEKGSLTNVAYNQCFTTFENQNDPNQPNSPGLSSITGSPSSTATSSSKSSLATSPPYPSSTGTASATGTGSAGLGTGTGTRPAVSSATATTNVRRMRRAVAL